jgi:hypothetical protein
VQGEACRGLVAEGRVGRVVVEHDVESRGFCTASAHMRPTLEGDMPTASAIVARLRCVALGGVSCTVLPITFSRTCLGKGEHPRGPCLVPLEPGTPSSRYRSCQRQIVGFDMHVRRMISTVP